jgi:hypothetical protein
MRMAFARSRFANARLNGRGLITYLHRGFSIGGPLSGCNLRGAIIGYHHLDEREAPSYSQVHEADGENR